MTASRQMVRYAVVGGGVAGLTAARRIAQAGIEVVETPGGIGAAVQRAVQAGRASGDYGLLALLCFGLAYMLTSTDTLITRPRELWVIVWFPLGLLAGQRLAAARQDSTTRTPATY